VFPHLLGEVESGEVGGRSRTSARVATRILELVCLWLGEWVCEFILLLADSVLFPWPFFLLFYCLFKSSIYADQVYSFR